MCVWQILNAIKALQAMRSQVERADSFWHDAGVQVVVYPLVPAGEFLAVIQEHFPDQALTVSGERIITVDVLYGQ